MPKWYQKYHQTGKIEPILGVQENEKQTEDSHPEIQAPQVMISKVTRSGVFDPWYGNKSENEEDSFEKIKSDVQASAQRLLEAVTFSDPDEFEEWVKEEIKKLIHIPQRVAALKITETNAFSYEEVVLR